MRYDIILYVIYYVI